jgi:tetratricopeptide (TPR) repeat protein
MAEHSDVEFDSRPYIECDTCSRPNPPKRCGRCSCAFYCSIECQRKHWRGGHKKSCRPLEEMRASLPSMDPSAIDHKRAPINSTCGICLEEPIQRPITLAKCTHAFCFSCLKEWQIYSKASLDTNSCPFCRQGIEKTVSEEALEKVKLQALRAGRLDKYEKKEERKALYDSALAEVDAILEMDEKDTVAIGVKAQILIHVRPKEAIATTHKILELDKIIVKKHENVIAELEKASKANEAGDTITSLQIMSSLESQYGPNHKTWPCPVGKGPYRLYPLRVTLAEAYEAAERWEEAQKEYSDMAITLYLDKMNEPNQDWITTDLAGQMLSMTCGVSRCLFHMKQYEKAIFSGQQAVVMDRSYPGVHKLIAEPQHALARQLGDAKRGKPRFAGMHDKTSTTIADAIRTMHRGHIYETPWDDVNKEANKEYLMRLTAEAAIAAFAARFD